MRKHYFSPHPAFNFDSISSFSQTLHGKVSVILTEIIQDVKSQRKLLPIITQISPMVKGVRFLTDGQTDIRRSGNIINLKDWINLLSVLYVSITISQSLR